MKIQTKLDVGDECYFIEDNKIKRGTLSKIEIYVNKGMGGVDDIYINYFVSKRNASTILQENSIFISVDDALDHLRRNVV